MLKEGGEIQVISLSLLCYCAVLLLFLLCSNNGTGCRWVHNWKHSKNILLVPNVGNISLHFSLNFSSFRGREMSCLVQ